MLTGLISAWIEHGMAIAEFSEKEPLKGWVLELFMENTKTYDIITKFQLENTTYINIQVS